MTPSSGRLYDFFLTLQQKPVLVIGDVMLDRYVQGEVERLSPEAPIPILSEKTHQHDHWWCCECCPQPSATWRAGKSYRANWC
jgi:hypothetical protein